MLHKSCKKKKRTFLFFCFVSKTRLTVASLYIWGTAADQCSDLKVGALRFPLNANWLPML